MPKRLYKLPLLALLLLCSPALAADTLVPANFSGTYTLSFSGIPFGRMQATIEVGRSNYRILTAVSTSGIAKLLARHSSDTEVRAKGTRLDAMDVTYETRTQTRNKKRDISYARRAGKIIRESVVPADNRESRPAVGELKHGSYDPLSLVVRIRQQVHAWQQGQGDANASFHLYDGRRLTQANVKVLGEKLFRGKPMLAASVRRKPLEGFSQKELAQYSPGEPALTLYFTADEQMLPVYLQIPFTFGTISAELQ
jgi:hypothetical protein